MDPKLIREARNRKRMTQEALGKIVGVGNAQISRFENGSRIPRIHEAEKIAQALDIPLSEISIRGEQQSAAAPPSSSKTSKSMLALAEGTAMFEYPAALSARSRKALKQWLDVMRDLVDPENL
jgi:transcriptional regulator with XRE-family HTH domain